jgi:hypothetical protein
MVHSTVLSIVVRTRGVFSSGFSNAYCKLSNQQRGSIASLPPSIRAGEDGALWKKADGTWGTDGKVVVIETTIPFLQDARPWEEGGKRRIASAKFQGEHWLF